MNDDSLRMLRNLLACIHRDGGHYVAKHGLEKAYEDAIEIVAGINAEMNEKQEEIADRVYSKKE